MSTVTFATVVILLSLSLAACTSAATSPSPAATTSVPPAAQAGSASAQSVPPATPNAVAAPTPSGASGELRYVLVAEASEARYRVREQLADRSLPSDAVGTTKVISGTIVVTPNGAPVPERSRITVDLRTLQSDSSRRDNFIRRNTLETDRFPLAELVPREVRGLPSPLPSNGEVRFELVGDLTVHGVTRPTTWQVSARVAGSEVTGSASTSVTFADFGMTRPRVAAVLSVEETIRLEVDFRLTRAAPPRG